MPVITDSMPLGMQAPDFALPTVGGDVVHLGDVKDATAILVAFLCNHCPYVKHIEDAFGQLTAEFAPRGVVTIGICSNDVDNYPDDDRAGLHDQATRAKWAFPYAIDEDQSVAKGYGAQCTPDLFVFDAAKQLTFRGGMDRSSPGNGEPNDGAMLRRALEQTMAGQPVAEPHEPAMGCGIKWKPGNAPAT